MRWIPFTVHIKVTPETPGKRFEYIRSMQKWSHLLYEELESTAGLNIADAGGGQHFNTSNGGKIGNSGLVKGLAVKPQIGETPAQFMITGFYDNSSATNQQPHVVVQRISGGETYEGRVASVKNTPNSWVDNDVYTIKSVIESALSTSLPENFNAKVFRIDYSGVVYGDRGYHFPLAVV